ncbi:MAG: stage II sporulation protein M [Anaerolineaceae bacterium]|nr:stage II sporulation protein M [Anaerolineaceae bacterium]
MKNLRDSLRPVFIVANRETRDQLRDWRIIFPVLGLTVFFPFLMNFTAGQMLGFVEKYGAVIIGERLVPFFLMIVGFFPISVSLVIALDSFVGEKERRSIEPLLNTPLEDWQLYLGKLISSTVPPLLSSYVGMSVYVIGLLIKGIPLPPAAILSQIVILTTVQAFMMVAGAVVVSSHATSVRAANLLASFIVIPSALLIQGESALMFWGTNASLWWVVFGLLILTALLVRVGLSHFQREELLGKEIDVLNFRWGWRVFKSGFTGGNKKFTKWLWADTRKLFSNIKTPLLLCLGIMITSIAIGYTQIKNFPIQLPENTITDIPSQVENLMKIWPVLSVQPIVAILMQNIRVVIVGFILGIFSLGVLGTLPIFVTMGLTGYLGAILSMNGIPIYFYLLFLLPHGLFEIPALLISTAAVIRIGATIASPSPGKTIGEVVLYAFGEWCRYFIGIVMPLLIVASIIEVWVTPQIIYLLTK